MSGSTRTGIKPFSVIDKIEAIYVLEGTIISSPGCINPNSIYARNIQIRASKPLAHPIVYLAPIYCEYFCSKLLFSTPCKYQPEFTTRATEFWISSEYL